MKSRITLFCLLIVSICAVNALGQNEKGIVSGHVVDSANAVLQGARISLEPGGIISATNGQGEFILTNLAAGSYTLTISFVGFQNYASTVSITPGAVVRQDVVMKVASGREEIIVTAPDPHGDAEAINRTRTSPNILDVLTNAQIMSLPNFTIADALGRLPGVTLERDEGDGKYVQIRGTEPRLTNTQIDGITVPSPESGVRQVKLDTIPADLVESVEINKTLSANQDGDSIGGTVNLVTRTAADRTTVSAFGQFGHTPILNGVYADQFGITAGKRFLGNKRLGILGNYTYDYNGRGIDDVEPTPDTGTLIPSYDSIDMREYQYDRTRWGFAGSVDYKLSQGSGLYAHGLYSDFKDYGNRWDYLLNNTVTPNPNSPVGEPPTYTGGLPQFGVSRRLPDYAISTIALGGNHIFTNSWLKWEASFARARQAAAAGNPGANFAYDNNGTQMPGDPLFDFATNNCASDPSANKSQNRPQWQPACTAPGSPIYTPSNYTLTELDETSGNTSQINLQGSASYAFNYHAGPHFSTLEFGAKFLNAHKGQFAYSPALVGAGPTMDQFLSDFTNNRYYGGSYRLGPVADYNKVVAYNNANPGVLVQDPYLTALNGDASNFDYQERIPAGYLMNTVELGKFRLQAGIRFEGTSLNSRGFQVTTVPASPANPSGYGGTVEVPGSSSYFDALPSVQLRYALTKNTDIRVSYGRGISRPDPQDIIPSVTIDQTTSPFTYSLGNPALKAEHANNFDISYEQYLNPLGLFQLSVFYKILGSPIIENTSFPTTGKYAGFKVSQFNNAGSAWVDGAEISYQQRWSNLPGLLGGLGFSGNYTFTNSEAFRVDPLRAQNPKLLRQAPNAWNLGPTYDRGPISINLGLEYNDASIYAYQYEDLQFGIDANKNPTNMTTPISPAPINGFQGPAGDNYLYPHLQVDAQISYRLPKGFSAYVNGQNLTNEVFGFYNGGPQYVVQREYYKTTYFGGLRWTLNSER